MLTRNRIAWISAFIAGLVTAVGLLIFLGGGNDQPTAAHAQNPPKGVKWEYCQLGTDVVSEEGQRKRVVYFDSGSDYTEKPDWDALADELKIPKGKNKERGGRLEIFNHLGTQGWELCGTITEINDPVDGKIYSNKEWVFKRVRP